MTKCLLQKNSFINIQPFMVINLGLDGVSLLIYALIYGHTVNKGVFYGSLEYMAQWCHCTTRNITNCINALEGKGLIRRKKTPKGCFYMTEKVKTDLPEYEEEEIENPFKDEYMTEESSEKKEKTSKDSEKSSCEDKKKVPENMEESSSNILDDNLDNKLDLNSSTNSSLQPNESSYKPFVPQEENSDKKVSAKRTNSGKATKNKKNKIDKEAIDSFLNTLSEQDTLNFKKCMTTFFEFKKKLDPKFNRRKEQLLEWEYEFVSFSKTSERSSEEILNTLTFTLSDQYWSKYMFAPKNFINKYETLFQQFVMKNKSYKPFTPQDKQPKRAVPSSQYL